MTQHGFLTLQPNGRFELQGQELTSGDVIEIAISWAPTEWLRARIEHGLAGYYLVIPSQHDRIIAELEGLKARLG